VSNLIIAAFLSPETEAVVKRVQCFEPRFAHSWQSLDKTLDTPDISFALIDPAADGQMNVGAVANLMRRHAAIAFAAYCGLRADNFRPLLQLLSEGLSEVFIHPLREEGSELVRAAQRLCASRVAERFLLAAETRVARLDPGLQLALKDLFERPHRYTSGSDIARQCSMSRRSLYRAFDSAGLGTPKKFVTIAKVLRGYSHLRNTRKTVEQISIALGYTNGRDFSAQCVDIFRCSASRLRQEENPPDVVTALIEWLYRPDEWKRRCAVELASTTNSMA
jgi:AraC-like DNA-binding protein